MELSCTIKGDKHSHISEIQLRRVFFLLSSVCLLKYYLIIFLHEDIWKGLVRKT
jgi:hypothetical protein